LVVYYFSTFNTKEDNDTKKIIKDDMVVHRAGKFPNTEGLDLNMGRIEYNDKGIKVNEFLQSISNPIVYATGDVAATAISGGSPLTPAASYDGIIVANNLSNGNAIKFNYNGLPSVVFTIPPIASVGFQENEAKRTRLYISSQS
jgi:glutathione reductase (NADPH)